MSPGLSLAGRVVLDWLTEWFLGQLAAQNNVLGLALLAASAALEYIFPPFPGDTITLLGAILITGYGWSFGLVFGAVMLGSLAGSMAAFFLGALLSRRRAQRRGDKAAAVEKSIIDGLVERFRRRGPAYLVVNRFLPGIRSLFFVAAGLAGMRPVPVLFYSALSAALWNLALIAAGALLGANLGSLEHLVRDYTAVAWIVLAAVAVALLLRAWLRRRARRK